MFNWKGLTLSQLGMVLMKYVLVEGWVFSKYWKKIRLRFPKQILQYFLQAALRHGSEMKQALYFSHLSISCLGNKQENLKKCITGIALSSGEDRNVGGCTCEDLMTDDKSWKHSFQEYWMYKYQYTL